MKQISDKNLKYIKGGNIRPLSLGWGGNRFVKTVKKWIKNKK